MEKLFINQDNLKKEDIDEETIRVKALVINDKDELLLEYNNYTFQFPGGHRKDDEALELTLLREIKEETGIDMVIDNGPFMVITEYCKNYRKSNKNRCNKIYYYIIRCNELPDYDKRSLSDFESKTDFDLVYVKMNEVENFLKDCIENRTLDDIIGYEMLEVLKVHKKLMGGSI